MKTITTFAALFAAILSFSASAAIPNTGIATNDSKGSLWHLTERADHGVPNTGRQEAGYSNQGKRAQVQFDAQDPRGFSNTGVKN